ncbi:hypothetical protein LUZ60_001141 [Juncus effusus]|nr:hypothetical protein LUZ60_001141 [Juncus effusus]
MAIEQVMAGPGFGPEFSSCLESFQFFETRSNFYLIGTNKEKIAYKILTIGRMRPSELNINEDHKTYTESEILQLKQTIHEENLSNGGLKFVTDCYGIIGFIKFLGPYYMLLITERKKIGDIFGHAIYQPTKSEMVVIPSTSLNIANSRKEDRYKNLLSTIDVTKDFFYSYSYNVMRCLQKNLKQEKLGQNVYDSMFVWNEYLTRAVRNNNLWTVALVYGFFKQDKYSVDGREFLLTLIARRSRHFAGTRYLKRGVNKKGRVANDVETEQIVSEINPNPTQICSIVQHRGSIPLFWSQETNKFNPKPDIILGDNNGYEATKLHFENLMGRYGNPIIILNLIKKKERKPRESVLRKEFIKAIEYVNKSLTPENHLKFLHWDLNMKPQSKAINVLSRLVLVATMALNLTGFFYCRVPPATGPDPVASWSAYLKNYTSDDNSENTDYADTISQDDILSGSSDTSARGITEEKDSSGPLSPDPPKSPSFQKGVLRTNCIDCLDRTNVAQYAFGLVALWHQLHSLRLVDTPEPDLDNPLAHDLMRLYEGMGDTLARQYGGSAAHNKIFSERMGHMKFMIRSQEFFRTIQRHYSNAYMDADKQAAINLFLGYFQADANKRAIWELESDEVLGEHGQLDSNNSFIRRALSDGNIIRNKTVKSCSIGEASTSNIPPSACMSTPTKSQRITIPPIVPDEEFENPSVEEEEEKECEETNLCLDTSWLYGPGEVPLKRSSRNGSTGGNTPIRSTGDVIPAESEQNGENVFRGERLVDAPGLSEKFRYWVDHGEHLFFY